MRLPRPLSVRRRPRAERSVASLVVTFALSGLCARVIVASLHDGPVQDVAGLSFGLAAAAQDVDRTDRERLRALLSRAADGTRESMRQLRSLLVTLHPPALQSSGLAPVLVDRELARTNGHVTLTVRDDRRGFSEAEVERRRREGHLGLSLLEDGAAELGGRLTVESAAGRGTLVRLEVPVA